jgi:hypothetical protein
VEGLAIVLLAAIIGSGGSGSGGVAILVRGGRGCGGCSGVVVGLLVLVSGLHAASQHHCAAQGGNKKQSFHSSKNFIGYFFANIIIKSKKMIYFAIKLKKTISFAKILVV